MGRSGSPAYPFELFDVPGAFNVRDIGGYPGRNGRPVQKRRFIRAGRMSGLPPEGVAAVRALGVDCVVDLRSRFEADQMPDTLRDDGEIAYIHIPMLDYIQSSMAGGEAIFPDSMEEMYLGLLENDKPVFRRLMETLADPAHETVLFHCTAGKDRTGLTAMLLLGLAEVSREDIVADYIPSGDLAGPRPIDPGLPGHLFESRAATMETVLDHLDRNYGGAAGYLAEIGVDEATRSALMEKLLGPPMQITRTEGGISYSLPGEAGSIGIISGAGDAVGIIGGSEGATEIRTFREEDVNDWMDHCAERLGETEPSRTVSQAIDWMLSRWDTEPLPPDDRHFRQFRANLVLNLCPEKLKNHPQPFSLDMTDEEFERHHFTSRAQWEEAARYPLEKLELRIHGFRLPDTPRNRPLYEDERELPADAYASRPPECLVFLEERTCDISGRMGSDVLIRELHRYLGLTREEIETRSPRFVGYISALAEEGILPTLEEFCARRKP